MKRYVKSTTLTDQEIKELLSKLLKNIPDAGLQTALRRIIFYDRNQIDWQDAYDQIRAQMPEVK